MDEHAVNLAARRAYAALLREFLAGRWNTDQYEDRWFEIRKSVGTDSAVNDIFDAVWHLYDDLFPHKMRGRRRLSTVLRKRISMWVLFLMSDEPYACPVLPPARRARRTGLLVGLAIYCACALLLGVALSWYLTLVLSTVLFGILYFAAWLGGGVSINSAVFLAAFNESLDSTWPFRDDESLRRARQHPVFLRGP